MKHLILIGFMGSGKSTLGLRLAKCLHLQYVDTDRYIEEKERTSIQEIFDTKGETFFRNLETEVLKELLQSDKKMIVSLGGGTPLREENQRLIKESDSFCVYLKMGIEEAYNRLKKDTKRPLLKTENPKKTIEELLTIRNPLYEETADYILDEEGKNVAMVLEELIEIEEKQNENFSN